VVSAGQGLFGYRDGAPGGIAAEVAEIAAKRKQLDRSRLEMMLEYAETRACRWQFLLGYFGGTLDEPCGFCDTCDAGTAAGRRC
jgi:ATP-dependent DNA helicase RecQ